MYTGWLWLTNEFASDDNKPGTNRINACLSSTSNKGIDTYRREAIRFQKLAILSHCKLDIMF